MPVFSGSGGGVRSSGGAGGVVVTGQSRVESKSFTSTSGDADFFETDTWCDVAVVVDGQAGGQNEIAVGSSGSRYFLAAGVPTHIRLAPKTRVKFFTTSQVTVRVDAIVTEETYVEELLNCIDAIGRMIVAASEQETP